MSNVHEYVIFDRAKLDAALSMRWPALEQAYPDWYQWESAKEFLVQYALDSSHIASVDTILSRKTVRQTLALSSNPFALVRHLLDEKKLPASSVDVEKGDYDYGDDIVSCAGAAFMRGDLSLATLVAVCRLHAGRVDPAEVLLPDVASKVEAQPAPLTMLPGLPNLLPEGAAGIGVAQTRKTIDFLVKAWREQWPLHVEGQMAHNGRSIRACAVAGDLFRTLQKCHFAKPCMFRWYEG